MLRSMGLLFYFGISIFCYFNCFCVLGAFVYWLCFDGIPHSALLWGFLLTNHSSIKWKKRSKEDLLSRSSCSVSRKRLILLLLVQSHEVVNLLIFPIQCSSVLGSNDVLIFIVHRLQTLSIYVDPFRRTFQPTVLLWAP